MSEAEEKWAVLIAQALALRGPPVRAMTYIETRSSASKPVKVSGSDGRLYFVKGGHARRQLVNDHIVGRLGKALGAPTAPKSPMLRYLARSSKASKVSVDTSRMEGAFNRGCGTDLWS